MGGTRAVREEPGKQKPRSALFASRYGTAGVGILPKQRPSKCAAEKRKCAESVHRNTQGVNWGGKGVAPGQARNISVSVRDGRIGGPKAQNAPP